MSSSDEILMTNGLQNQHEECKEGDTDSEEDPDFEEGFRATKTVENARNTDATTALNEINHQPHSLTPTLPSSNQPQISKKRSYNFQKRIPNPRGISKRKTEWFNVLGSDADSFQLMVCCKKLRCFSQVNKEFLRLKMESFLVMSNKDRRQVLSSMLCSSGAFHFDGRKVCSTFLLRAFRFSRDVQKSVKSIINTTTNIKIPQLRHRTTSLPLSNPNSPAILVAPAREAVISFLHRIAEETGDKMPDTTDVHLPFHQKQDVFHHFKEDFKRTTMESSSLPSKSYFLRVWKDNCRFIKVRKATRFAKCDICENLRDEIKRHITSFQSTSRLVAQKRAHYAMIADERLEYKRKRDTASLNPQEAWSIIIDGADQTAFGLPHFVTKTKSQRGHTLKIKLVGLLEHCSTNKLRLLTMTEEHRTGANHIIEALHRYLMDRSVADSPPPRFYIQVDNCTRENKNRYFFSYVESLIRWKIFKEIEVSFLPVGHTHEDIDQAFSTTSGRLNNHDAVTLQDLLQELRQVYNKYTAVAHMKHLVNWSGLCEEESVLTSVKNFSHFRYFRFYLENTNSNDQSSSTATCMVKVNVKDDWEKLSTSFLSKLPDLSKTPATVIQNSNQNWLEKKTKVTDRIESEEGRIRNPEKLGELKALRDSVFRSRKEKFHWDLSQCIELNRRADTTVSNGPNDGQEITNETVDNEIEIGVQQTKTNPSNINLYAEERCSQPSLTTHFEGISNRISTNNNTSGTGYSYEIGSYVAVLSKTADNTPSFWVGKVISTSKDNNGVVKTIFVHWHDPYTRGSRTVNKFTDRYAPSYLNKGKKNEKPWTNSIEPSVVVSNFESLLQTKRLPSSVQKHLRTALPSLHSIQ